MRLQDLPACLSGVKVGMTKLRDLSLRQKEESVHLNKQILRYAKASL